VKPDKLEELVRHIRDILNEAILAGGSTLQDFQGADGTKGEYQQRFLVYDREGEPCPNCGKPIKRLVQSGRSSFYCGSCQK
jgi:formamidopyrimidine-DNA glycosylase